MRTTAAFTLLAITAIGASAAVVSGALTGAISGDTGIDAAPLASAAIPDLNATGPGRAAVWDLFMKSLDVFTYVLILGSFLAAAVTVRCVIDIRSSQIAPEATTKRLDDLIDKDRMGEVKELVRTDQTFVGLTMAAAHRERDKGRDVMLDAAEMEASVQTAGWFRRIELLNIIGNLGPLIGLAGTVWGMITAFSALTATSGTAQPDDLAFGIAKALFHTLLGLILAIPCLFMHGVYRSAVDRICTRAMSDSSRLAEKLATKLHGLPERDRAPAGRDA